MLQVPQNSHPNSCQKTNFRFHSTHSRCYRGCFCISSSTVCHNGLLPVTQHLSEILCTNPPALLTYLQLQLLKTPRSDAPDAGPPKATASPSQSTSCCQHFAKNVTDTESRYMLCTGGLPVCEIVCVSPLCCGLPASLSLGIKILSD